MILSMTEEGSLSNDFKQDEDEEDEEESFLSVLSFSPETSLGTIAFSHFLRLFFGFTNSDKTFRAHLATRNLS